MAVDIGRRPYTTTARFFRNSDVETKIKWLPADPARGTFPGVSRICSLDWVTHPETAEGVGEVFNTSRSYNRGKSFGPIGGNHFCGTLDEHRNGEVLDPTRPMMEYAPSGLPLCCDPNRREALDGPKVLNQAYAVRSNPYPSSVRVSVLTRSTHGTTGPAFGTTVTVSVLLRASTVRSESREGRAEVKALNRSSTMRSEPREGRAEVKVLNKSTVLFEGLWGALCINSKVGTLGEIIWGWHFGFEFQEWAVWNDLTFGEWYEIYSVAESPEFLTLTVWVGDDCDGLGAVDEFGAGDNPKYVQAPMNGSVWISAQNTSITRFGVRLSHLPGGPPP